MFDKLNFLQKIVVFIFYHDADLRKAVAEEEVKKGEEKLLKENGTMEEEKAELNLKQTFRFEETKPLVIDSVWKLLIQEQVFKYLKYNIF